MSNTASLSNVRNVATPVAPGGTITLPVEPSALCGPTYVRLYRESFGRWRQTHRSSDLPGQRDAWHRDEPGIWTWPRMHVEFSSLPCPLAHSVTLTIPADVSWSPVVACTSDGACVRVEVAL